MNSAISFPVKKFISKLKYWGLFGFYFLLQLGSLNGTWFTTDELDIMLGGKCIANGYQLYGDFSSQHMPMSYYISALFDCLGATTVTWQRIYFYAFFAFMWTYIFACYSKYTNKKALFFYPILFCCLISTYDMGTAILSEHIAGIGFVILYLEYITFCNTRDLNKFNYINISCSILLTFGTVFIAAFGIFFVVVGVLAKEIEWQFTDKLPVKQLKSNLKKKYSSLIIFISLPWILLCGYYLINNNLKIFFFSAYTLNRTIYSKYLLGYGESILKTFLSIPTNICNHIIGLFDFSSFNYVKVLYMIVLMLVIYCFITFYKKNGFIMCFVLCLSYCALSTRGCYNYHGTQWVAATSLFASIALSETVILKRESFYKKSAIYQAIAAASIILITCNSLGNFYRFLDCKVVEEPLDTARVISEITDEKEAIWLLSFNNDAPMIANRAAIQNVGSTPWFWEGFGIQTLERFSDISPRVLLYSPEQECWGYKMADYAPELIEFVNKHYTNYYEDIYVRNDYYKEACEILKKLFFIDNSLSNGIPISLISGEEIHQKIYADGGVINSIEIMVGTYGRINSSNLFIKILDENNQVMYTNTLSCLTMKQDNSWYNIMDEEIMVEEGNMYTLIISTDAKAGNNIAIYATTYYNGDEFSIIFTEGEQSEIGQIQIKVKGQ